jgi:membrane-associated phospholipid phosphatase
MPGASSSSDSAGRMSWREFVSTLPARIRAHWQFKVVLSAALSVLFCVPYLLIGHHPLLPVHTLPLTWVDRAIGFHPLEWVWIYQSNYLLFNLVPWLTEQREHLRRYVIGFAILSLFSFVVYILYPIRAPKPEVPNPTGMYWLLLQYDAPLNSLPSLHAGFLIYTLAYGRRILGDRIPVALRSLCILWGGLILYGTLATKEHYLVDIIAGAALALFVHWLAWRKAQPLRQTLPPPLPGAVEPLAARS